MHAASFRCLSDAHAIDEDAAHQSRRNAEEMRAALPLDLVLVYQPEKDFVNESGGLECEFVPLTPEIIGGHSAQLLIEQRHQLFECALLAVAPPFEKPGDVRLRLHRWVSRTNLHDRIPGVREVEWLGGRDSNPDSQIQSLKPLVLLRSPYFWIVLTRLTLSLTLPICVW